MVNASLSEATPIYLPSSAPIIINTQVHERGFIIVLTDPSASTNRMWALRVVRVMSVVTQKGIPCEEPTIGRPRKRTDDPYVSSITAVDPTLELMNELFTTWETPSPPSSDDVHVTQDQMSSSPLQSPLDPSSVSSRSHVDDHPIQSDQDIAAEISATFSSMPPSLTTFEFDETESFVSRRSKELGNDITSDQAIWRGINQTIRQLRLFCTPDQKRELWNSFQCRLNESIKMADEMQIPTIIWRRHVIVYINKAYSAATGFPQGDPCESLNTFDVAPKSTLILMRKVLPQIFISSHIQKFQIMHQGVLDVKGNILPGVMHITIKRDIFGLMEYCIGHAVFHTDSKEHILTFDEEGRLIRTEVMKASWMMQTMWMIVFVLEYVSEMLSCCHTKLRILVVCGQVNFRIRSNHLTANNEYSQFCVTTTMTPHPLDPLNLEEINDCVNIFKKSSHHDASSVYRYVTKKRFITSEDGCHTKVRQGMMVLLNSNKRRAEEVIVDLLNKKVVSLDTMAEGVQPAYTPQDYEDCERIIQNDPSVAEALRQRGIHDPKEVMVDLWASGRGFVEETDAGPSRIAKPILYLRDETDTIAYGYGRPVEGLTPVIDLYAQKILYIEDLHRDVPVAKSAEEQRKLREKSNPSPTHDPRKEYPIKPIDIVQPEGPSFALDGHHVRWQGWDLNVGFNAREGLTLHALQIWDDEKKSYRPVLYRASCAEMVVPYAEPHAPTYRRNAFDAGEEGLGFNVNSLSVGCDCLGVIHYLDAALNTSGGEARVVKNAICVHEEDDGVLWKHTDWRSGNAVSARSRKLSISSFATVANYDYGFFWYLFQDGTIQCEVKLTGIMLPIGVKPETKATDMKHSLLLGGGVAAPYHQHIFSFRLETAVDGFSNSIYEVNAEVDTLDNPQGNAFVAKKTLFKRELDAQRDIHPQSGRYWNVVNHSKRNAIDEPVAYKLLPGDNSFTFLHPLSPVRRRAGFVGKHLWVTPFRAAEKYPVGNYPNRPDFSHQGLPSWTQQNRSIVDESLVLWYTMNVLHIPRLEEWPIMPVVRAGFKMQAEGFFNENPTLHLRQTQKNKTASDHNYSVCLVAQPFIDTITENSSCNPIKKMDSHSISKPVKRLRVVDPSKDTPLLSTDIMLKSEIGVNLLLHARASERTFSMLFLDALAFFYVLEAVDAAFASVTDVHKLIDQTVSDEVRSSTTKSPTDAYKIMKHTNSATSIEAVKRLKRLIEQSWRNGMGTVSIVYVPTLVEDGAA
ncbi:tyramine oxidase [Planoprotostelium fungivorum]|uniref:Amine oxidase n=1 Tax=Planoprotostelium fungivorum TaxID=1890364 RepID=A0A2P6NNE0_9EUKA|nr:tyramine oxidase [Planoprotostelium fungivorum]